MSDEIVLYHNPMSRGRIIHWMLEEVGAPYRLEVLDFAKGEHKTASFLALNPMGKLPTLVHRGVVVTESGAICTYLADAFPAAGLAPACDDPQRATYLRWLFFGAGCIEPAIVDRMLARPAVERTSALGYGSYDDVIRTLEIALQPGPFLLGERFSAADVYVGSQLQWATMVKALDPRPRLQAYMARLMERPALKRVYQASSEMMKKG
jgi:glutathione S-transferase